MAKLPRIKSTKCTTEIKLRFCSRVARRAERDGYKKEPGGKLNSPPGLKLGVVTPKAFGVVMKREGVNASFSLLFSRPPFCVFLPSTIPPFQSADAEGCEEFEMNSTSLTNGSVTITFFLSNIFLACSKIFLRARAR